jgi:hypothetical protein
MFDKSLVLLVLLASIGRTVDVPTTPGAPVAPLVLAPEQFTTIPLNRAATDIDCDGYVLDCYGHPVSGATVYAVADRATWGPPISPIVRRGKTSETGFYHVLAVPVTSYLGVTMVAAEQNFAPEIDAVNQPSVEQHKMITNLVLRGPGGDLSVEVTNNNGPVSGAKVLLSSDNKDKNGLYSLYDERNVSDPPTASLKQLLTPLVTADAHGMAHFQDLLPGRWKIIASQSPDRDSLQNILIYDTGGDEFDYSVADGISVQAGRERYFNLKILAESNTVTCQILRPNGAAYSGPSLNFTFSRGHGGRYGWGGMGAGPPGYSTVIYQAGIDGLWHVTFHFKDDPTVSAASNNLFDDAEGVFALSPSLNLSSRIVLHAVRSALSTPVYNPDSQEDGITEPRQSARNSGDNTTDETTVASVKTEVDLLRRSQVNPVEPLMRKVEMSGARDAIDQSHLHDTGKVPWCPGPRDLCGTITVGGGQVSKLTSAFTVRAEYLGSSQESDAASVEVSAQADGTFVIDGLRPGRYMVQASRDSVWLSKSQTMDFSGFRSISPITLDIPPPGAPTLITIVGKKGEPICETSVAFDAPNGPLTDRLWPTTFRTDGVGEIEFDGFSEGNHTITIAGMSHTFSVPRYASQSESVPVTIQSY